MQVVWTGRDYLFYRGAIASGGDGSATTVYVKPVPERPFLGAQRLFAETISE